MKRQLTGVIAAGLTVTLGAGACAKGSLSGGDGRTITFAAAIYDTDTERYWKGLIKDFEARNTGYKVDLRMVDWGQIDQQVKTWVQTRQTPDLLNYNAYSDLARDGLIHKASDIVSPQVMSDFLPQFTAGATYRGEQYALPFISSVRQLFYNKDIFAKAGISGPPKSWADVKTDAAKIKKAGFVGYGLPLGPEEAQAEFHSWAMNNGGGWVDSAGRWTIDQRANVETLTFLKDLTSSGLTQPNPETTDRKTVFNQFAQGKIGMAVNGPMARKGFIDPVDKDVPPDKWLKFDVAPLPSKDGKTHDTLGVQDFLVGFRNGGKNRQALARFLNFFYQKDNTARFLKAEGFLSVTRSAADALSGDPYYLPFVTALPNARFAPTDKPAWAAVSGAVKQSLGTAVADRGPKKVLTDIQHTAEKNG